MIYFALDLETPSLSPKGGILQLALVLEDTTVDTPVDQLQHFVGYVVRDSYDHVEPYAASMHAGLWRKIDRMRRGDDAEAPIPHNRTEAMSESSDFLCNMAANWVRNVLADRGEPEGRVTVAGKNVATFDYQFITDELKACFRHRVLDPGSGFADFSRKTLPSLDELLERFGLGRTVQHDALEDARDVIRVLRCAPGYSSRPSPVDAMHDAIDAARTPDGQRCIKCGTVNCQADVLDQVRRGAA